MHILLGDTTSFCRLMPVHRLDCMQQGHSANDRYTSSLRGDLHCTFGHCARVYPEDPFEAGIEGVFCSSKSAAERFTCDQADKIVSRAQFR